MNRMTVRESRDLLLESGASAELRAAYLNRFIRLSDREHNYRSTLKALRSQGLYVSLAERAAKIVSKFNGDVPCAVLDAISAILIFRDEKRLGQLERATA